MIFQQGELFNRDKVQESINILRYLEPERGYWLAFSGGKDSIVIKQLAIEAGVKFVAHYNLTTLDPPELVGFIRKHHRDVIVERPLKSFRRLCLDHGAFLPTRKIRFCCEILKEKSGPGSAIITGIRAAESNRRADRDNFEFSYKDASKVYIHPIMHWTDSDVWAFIRNRNLPYCELYDRGWKRIGCLFCPMASTWRRNQDLIEYPHHAARILSICSEIISERKRRGLRCVWNTGEELLDWWINDRSAVDNSMPLFDEAGSE
jgi:phosphoadenosine phosphosulfate reductase